jgi:hypothetical protein
MAEISSNPKPAYIYDQGTNTWHPISGQVNLSLNYPWTGTHNFASTVNFSDVVNARAGINNFQNPAARDAAIPSPTNGIVVFVRQNSSGTVINQIQYYHSGAWVSYDATLQANIDVVKQKVDYVYSTSNYTVNAAAAGKTIYMDSASDLTVTIPLNSTAAIDNYVKMDFIRGGTGNASTNGNYIQFRSIWMGTEDFIIESSTRLQQLSSASQRFSNSLIYGSTNNNIQLFYSDNVNGGKWLCECTSASIMSSVDSGVTVAINTWYNLKIVRISMICYFYVNNVLVGTISTNVPSGIDAVCQQQLTKLIGTTSVTADFDYLKMFDL